MNPSPPVLLDLVAALDATVENYFSLVRVLSGWLAENPCPFADGVDALIVQDLNAPLRTCLDARHSLAREALDHGSGGSIITTVSVALHLAALAGSSGRLLRGGCRERRRISGRR